MSPAACTEEACGSHNYSVAILAFNQGNLTFPPPLAAGPRRSLSARPSALGSVPSEMKGYELSVSDDEANRLGLEGWCALFSRPAAGESIHDTSNL